MMGQGSETDRSNSLGLYECMCLRTTKVLHISGEGHEAGKGGMPKGSLRVCRNGGAWGKTSSGITQDGRLLLRPTIGWS